LCPNFKAIGEEVSEITYYEQSHIYVFIYIDVDYTLELYTKKFEGTKLKRNYIWGYEHKNVPTPPL
jgi:hypothetical protein